MKLSVRLEFTRQIIHDIASILAILPLVPAGISLVTAAFIEEQSNLRTTPISNIVETQFDYNNPNITKDLPSSENTEAGI